MAYQHGIVITIHLALYFLLYPFWKKITLLNVGLSVLMQFIGVDSIVLSLKTGQSNLASLGVMLILCSLVIPYLSRNVSFSVGGKKYAGLREFLLLIDTDLKYVIGLFFLSLILNLYFNPLSGLLNYMNLTSVIAFFLSLPFCRKMSKLEERDVSSKNRSPKTNK